MRFLVLTLISFTYFCAYAQPTVNFTFSPTETTICAGTSVTFTQNVSSNGGGAISNYTWYIGGNVFTGPSVTYNFPTASAPGSVQVTLTVMQNGTTYASQNPVNFLVNPNPIAKFSFNQTCSLPVTVNFFNESTAGSSLEWTFAGGSPTSSTTTNPTVVYAAAGTYTVKLKATKNGCSKDTTLSLVISDYLADFTITPIEACVGEVIQFTDVSTVGTNKWSWDVDNNTSTDYTIKNPTHTYNVAGTYTVKLTAQNTTSNCSASKTRTVKINPKPTVIITTSSPLSGCAPLEVDFNSPTVGTNYSWDFGDGGGSSIQNPPPYTYNTNGVYAVSLTVTDLVTGCVGDTTLVDSVRVSAPIVGFKMDKYNGCDPLTVQFTDTSTVPNPGSDPITSWTWSFGDGAPNGTVQNPSHTYSVGVYTVSLTVTTAACGPATVTLVDTIQVGKIDKVNFEIDPNYRCARKEVKFIAKPTISVITSPATWNEIKYEWDFGVNSDPAEGTGTDSIATHVYVLDTGNFDIKLTVNFRGCILDTIIKDTVRVLAPISKFGADKLFCNIPFPVPVHTTDTSIIGQASDDVKMIWSWRNAPTNSTTVLEDADLDPDDDGSEDFDYNQYGTFMIKQAIYNYTTGCSDSTEQQIDISEVVANFRIDIDPICKNTKAMFIDESTTDSEHEFGTFSYDMGNGMNVEGTNDTIVSNTYTTAGDFTVTQTSTNKAGCSASSTQLLKVLELPNPIILYGPINPNHPTNYCEGDEINLDGSTSTFTDKPIASYSFVRPYNPKDTINNVTTDFIFPPITTSPTVFPFKLIVTDTYGCENSIIQNLSVTKPIANFTLSTKICNEVSFVAVNQASPTIPPPAWLVDDVAVPTTDLNYNLIYAFNDVTDKSITTLNHTVKMVKYDANQCVDSISKVITNIIPHVDYTYVPDPLNMDANGNYSCPPVVADLNDNSVSETPVVGWYWNFFTNGISTKKDANILYNFAGIYDFYLEITDSEGCKADTLVEKYLTIGGPSGIPAWTKLPDICNQTYFFQVADQKNVSTIIWTLGDESVVNDTNSFIYNYAETGTFKPTVILEDNTSCKVSYKLNDIVIPDNGLKPFFTANPTEAPAGAVFNFTDGSEPVSKLIEWTWTADGTTLTNGTSIDFSRLFYTSGFYPVKLRVKDTSGCYNTYKVIVKVTGDFAMPNVFTPNGDGVNDLYSLYDDIFVSFDILIQNRWGNVVEDRKEQTGTLLWDGTNKGGDPCNEGVYFYQIRGVLKDGTPINKSGFLTKI
jgi:gliding motility-associated-like protein